MTTNNPQNREALKFTALTLSILILSLIITIPSTLALTYQIQYDANGNRIQDDQFHYEYNNFNQLSRVRLSNSTGTIIEEYLYDHEGQRILKKTINESTFYVNQNFIRVQNESGTFDTTYYYDRDTLVARKDPDGSKFYYHPDHLGSTTLITNQSGAVVEETTY